MSQKHSTRSTLSIKIPGKAALKGLVKSLKLNTRQFTVLDRAIRAAEWDERTYRAMRPMVDKRQSMVKSIRTIDRQLDKLLSVMGQAGPDLDQLLPRAAQDAIVAAMTGFAKQKLLGPALGLSGALPSHRLESLAISHPGTLLKTFLAQVQAPISEWVALDQLNKGGRPADLPRTLLVCSLAEPCPELLGREAPITTTGSFVRLCAEVLLACGLDDTGVDKLVPKVVRHLRKCSKTVSAGQGT